ncbi:MAG: P-loop NTPase [Oscillospiraceae bacterium]|nr:P-loop NTPase [Oscillospiraceae bacterium]
MARKIIIASGKGGVGKSTLTTGLCFALEGMGRRVLAVDSDIGLRSLDILMDAGKQSIFDWGDVLLGSCEPEKAVVKADGVSLLKAPLKHDKAFTPESTRDMIAKYDGQFDYILIDAPAGISDGFLLAASMADEGIIVATPDRVCVRSAEAAADRLLELGITNLRMVINRFNRKAVEQSFLLNIDSVIDSTRVRLIGVVPDNMQLMFCLIRGMKIPPKNMAYKAFERIARRIEGERVPLEV